MPSLSPYCETIFTPAELILFLTLMILLKGFLGAVTSQDNHKVAKESAKSRGSATSRGGCGCAP